MEKHTHEEHIYEDMIAQGLVSPQKIGRVVSFAKALGDETRLRILYRLSQGELCVSDITQALSLTQSAVSHQLRILKNEGLVKTRRDGKNIYYSLDDLHVVHILGETLEHVCHKMEED